MRSEDTGGSSNGGFALGDSALVNKAGGVGGRFACPAEAASAALSIPGAREHPHLLDGRGPTIVLISDWHQSSRKLCCPLHHVIWQLCCVWVLDASSLYPCFGFCTCSVLVSYGLLDCKFTGKRAKWSLLAAVDGRLQFPWQI